MNCSKKRCTVDTMPENTISYSLIIFKCPRNDTYNLLLLSVYSTLVQETIWKRLYTSSEIPHIVLHTISQKSVLANSLDCLHHPKHLLSNSTTDIQVSFTFISNTNTRRKRNDIYLIQKYTRMPTCENFWSNNAKVEFGKKELWDS